jgi:TatD DNase family protein
VTYFDAHNHLHDARLAPHRESFLAELARLPVARTVANGTREEDWDAVQAMSGEHPWIIPSYGLHPWYAPARSKRWLERLRGRLEEEPRAYVGEIGLDRWIEGHDLDLQRAVFMDQLRLAVELDRPATIHCVRAWGALWDVLRDEAAPRRGFLLHAYGGPPEMIAGFVERGAYFSFSPYFLHERKAAQRNAFARVPAARLLVETDAPDLRPPDESNPRPIVDSDGNPANHPANIDVSYRGLAAVRGMEVAELAPLIAENFARLLGGLR